MMTIAPATPFPVSGQPDRSSGDEGRRSVRGLRGRAGFGDEGAAAPVATVDDPYAEASHLVALHRAGDPGAFEEVYRRHAPRVYNLCLSLSGSPQRAEDLSQEVFLRIYRHLGKFQGRARLETWIYRITVNHCRSRLGRRRLDTTPLESELEERTPELADPRRGPEALALARDQGRCLSRALAEVPSPFREAVVLRDLEGLAYEEIAEILGVRIGTVRSRIARGRDHLRRILEAVSAGARETAEESDD